MPKFKRQAFSAVIIVPLILGLLVAACTSNDNGHTTATTVVTAPRRQVLTVVEVQPTPVPTKTEAREAVSEVRPGVDPTKPLLTFNLPEGKTFKSGEVVVLHFSLVNAKLKGDGGEYRVRYFVDDDDPRWSDDLKPIGLAGWLPDKHTIRLELIGPDGWPYRNGDQNIVTREIIVST